MQKECELIPILKEKFKEQENFQLDCLDCEDFLKMDLDDFIKTNCKKEILVCENFSCYIATPIIIKILESKTVFKKNKN